MLALAPHLPENETGVLSARKVLTEGTHVRPVLEGLAGVDRSGFPGILGRRLRRQVKAAEERAHWSDCVTGRDRWSSYSW